MRRHRHGTGIYPEIRSRGDLIHVGGYRPRCTHGHLTQTRPSPRPAPPPTPPGGNRWMGYSPPHGRQNHHPIAIHTGLPGRGGPHHDQPPHALSTPPTENPGTRAISPCYDRPNKTPNTTPRCDPRRRNWICLGHPRQSPSPHTRPTNDGPIHGPQRPQVRIGSTSPHPLMAKPPTQGGTR